MDAILQGLQSSDVKVKLKAIDNLYTKLKDGKAGDVKLKLINTAVTTLKDANPKLVLTALECVKLLIENYSDSFQPLVNMAFDILLAKLGDSKLNVRARANETMVALINSVGLHAGYERLSAHLSHNNGRIREQILHVIRRLIDIFGDDIVIIPNLGPSIGSMLRDPQDSVRQMAVQVLGDLYTYLGHSLLAQLESAGAKPAHIQAVRDAANDNSKSKGREESSVSSTSTTSSLSQGASPTPRTSMGKSSRGGGRLAATSSSAAMRSKKGDASNLSLTTAGLSAGLKTSPISSPDPRLRITPSPEALMRHGSNNSTMSAGTDVSGSSCNGSKYNPAWYMSLLGEGPPVRVVYPPTEKELQRYLGTIQTDLCDKDNWQTRIGAMGRLQGLVAGVPDKAEAGYTDIIVGFVRSNLHELISSQIVDLRSTVSKEGCRTVAVMARVLRHQFAPLAELWIPSLLKVLTVKIQVISSAVDRCLRIIIAAGVPVGFSRVIPLLIESFSSKNPISRKYCFEYLTLAASIWHSDSVLERHGAAIRKAARNGVSDADPHARKTARYLFWVLHSRHSWKRSMDALLSDMDASSKKRLCAEDRQQGELCDLINGSSVLSDIDLYDLSYKDANVSDLSAEKNSPVVSSGKTSGLKSTKSWNNMSTHFNSTSDSDNSDSRTSGGSGLMAGGSQRVTASSTTNRDRVSIDVDDANKIDGSNLVSPLIPPTDGAAPMRSKRMSVSATGGRSAGALSGGCRRMSMGPSKVSVVSTDNASAPESSLGGSARLPLGATQRSHSSSHVVDKDTTVSRGIADIGDGRQSGDISRGHTMNYMREEAEPSGPLQRTMGGAQRVARPVHRPDSKTSTDMSALRVQQKSTPVENAPKDVTTSVHIDVEGRKVDSGELNRSTGSHPSLRAPVPSVAASANIPSVSETRDMLADPLWTNRVRGLEAITARFKRWLASANTSGNYPAHLDEFLDVCIKCIPDSHQKVSAQAHLAIEVLATSRNALIISKLGTLLPLLFGRLADRRPANRSQANSLLDIFRDVHDPCTIMGVLSPRIPDMSDRTLVSVFQLLITITPMCGAFFSQASNTGAFLNRLSVVLSTENGKRPSSALQVAGQRLVDLVYKASSEVVLTQISLLPLQHQSTMKKVLQSRVPNIDSLVAAAGKLEWNTQHTQSNEKMSYGSRGDSYDTEIDTTDNSVGEDISVLTGDDSQNPTADNKLVNEISENNSRAKTYSPIAYVSPIPKKSPVKEFVEAPASCAPVMLSDPDAYSSPVVSPRPTSCPISSDRGTKDNVNEAPVMEPKKSPPKQDIVWLLHTLRPDGGASKDEKRTAISELKRLAKSASDEYWRRNCAQIMSVLLEAFSPSAMAMVTKQDEESAKLSSSASAGVATSPSSREGDYYSSMPHLPPSMPLTGLSPAPTGTYTSRKMQFGVGGEENWTSSEINSAAEENGAVNGAAHAQRMEAMHVACKGVLILVKVLGGEHIKVFMELIVSRLCEAAAFAPVAVSLHFEQILSIVSALAPSRFVRLLLPYITVDPTTENESTTGDEQEKDAYKQHTRLMSLHAMTAGVKYLSSSELIELLPILAPAVLPHFTSPLVDIRKSVVFVLVEIYMIVGDALHPYVKTLAPSQRKLLTVYIERQMSRHTVPACSTADV
mmetsp:Transcript_248/g.445  ORF Transcript_248/g.445 Transcript_248/m.445 type:complete len:1648 (-) Transcript_248:185-5128(-)|eukprot:CAMPEP_0185033808 /NCGR_PEP_ID=MMETSP1103-20130426/23147_1 /TAXON_ID=36769 /ORGANISM="Paraphysomonas bandaiensis, Strain Caron Lab Isolate" /LENGTH=1647 /DNA_ID=CAMNT_0027570221 /DNA_START=115 /DNA_END=5058 /DNA_ORIENTATION=-